MATYEQRLRRIRGMLDYLWGEMDDDEAFTGPGTYSAKFGVSDAMDALDKAILACPEKERANG